MKVLFKVDGDGNGYVAALDTSNVDSSVAEHRKAATVPKGQEIELDFPDVLSADQIGFGNVTDSESGDVVTETPGSDEGQTGADKPGGGNEGSPAGGEEAPAPEAGGGEGAGPTSGEGEGGGAPAGDGGAQAGEPASTSAASEKPLYLVDGDAVPDGFEPSGLETPEGKTLFHFGSDTAGQSATGNADGVSVYADADDNEKPVQPAEKTDSETEQPAAS
jgi:hypothetical protein